MKRLLLAAIAFVAVALSTTAAPAQSSGPGSSLVFFPSGGATGGSYRPLPQTAAQKAATKRFIEARRRGQLPKPRY
jgi:Spy/CpxP family protein refolding chaperone